MNETFAEYRARLPFHQVAGVKFQAVPVSPSETSTPLQMVCFLDSRLNQHYAGGTEAVDQHLSGGIKALRAADHFRGDFLETLLLEPRDGQIKAAKLLLLGLGDPEQLTLTRLESLGHLAVMEAIKLGVPSFSFAPSLKDAGLSSFSAAEVAEVLSRGMVRALKSAHALAEKKLLPNFALEEIIFLAGAAHLASAQD
ncbi:MAG: hypothetical protein EOP11_25400, partial [Proteobacteria bacterium]